MPLFYSCRSIPQPIFKNLFDDVEVWKKNSAIFSNTLYFLMGNILKQRHRRQQSMESSHIMLPLHSNNNKIVLEFWWWISSEFVRFRDDDETVSNHQGRNGAFWVVAVASLNSPFRKVCCLRVVWRRSPRERKNPCRNLFRIPCWVRGTPFCAEKC